MPDRWRAFGAIAVMLSLSTIAQAENWNVVLNGKAIHIDSSKDWNESNWGLGFEREFDVESRWVKVALGNGFRDSNDEMSYMAGAGIKRRFRVARVSDDFYVDLGVVGFLMSRQDVNEDRPFPGLLPALTFGTRNVALNVTYLPKSLADGAVNMRYADATVTGVVFLQLKFDARVLGFRDRERRVLAAAD